MSDPSAMVTLSDKVSVAIAVASLLLFGGAVGWGIGHTPDPAPERTPAVEAVDPGCQEDEAAVVAPDPDPDHGLTWVCVNLEDLP